MELTEKLHELDNAFVEGRIDEVANDHMDKNVVAHIQNLVNLRGKSAVANLHQFRSGLGDDATVQVMAQRTLEDESTTVSLYVVDGSPADGRRIKSLFLIARRFNDKGKVVEEEILPVGSTADAQPYFPEQKLPAKQIQPRLSFISATRKRRSGKSGGRPPRPTKQTDLHRLRMVGPKVLSNMHEAGIENFTQLSQASDEVLETIRDASGRKLRNFDYNYWREAAKHAAAGNFDAIPEPQRNKAQKIGKRGADVDFSQLRDDDIHYLPKVGKKLLEAFHDQNIHTFSDLAHADDEQLEALREPAGRPFVNFDMTYFRTAAQKKLDGAKSVPKPPKPVKAAGAKGAAVKSGYNPNDLHILPGVGAQLVAALHNVGIYTFADLVAAPLERLQQARSETRGKYKNIDLNYLKRQAKFAAAEQPEKFEQPVKIEKVASTSAKADPVEKFQAKLRAANESDINLLPSLGPGIRQELANRGIHTMSDIANADDAVLQDVVANAGRRFAKFDTSFWKKAAANFLAGDFDKIPARAPVAEKKPKTGRKRGPKPGGKSGGRTPRDEKDLTALPQVGTTVAHEFKAAGLDTFQKIAKASDDQLRAVRANAGRKFKSFDISYWKKVAGMAAAGEYDFPAPPRAEKAETEKKGRRGRQPKPISPTKLSKLDGVGATFAKHLRDNGINTWHDLADAESWLIMKAISEAPNRFRKLKPEALKQSAKDAINGKFPEKKKRKPKASLPAGHDDFTALPGIGEGVQTKLHQQGIRSYNDLSKAAIGVLEEVRDQVRGRVAKANVRDWKELARLAKAGEWHKVDPSKYAEGDSATGEGDNGGKSKKPKAEAGKDDFRRIKSIGPQAVQMFHSRGIKTFIQIAAMSDDALAAILEEGGPRTKNLSPADVRDAAAELAAEAHGSIPEKSKGKDKGEKGSKGSNGKAAKGGDKGEKGSKSGAKSKAK